MGDRMHGDHDAEQFRRKAKAHLRSLFTPAKLLVGGTIIASVVLGFLFSDAIQSLRDPIHAHPVLGIGIFMGVLIVVTVFPFVTSLPLLPVAGAVWGFLLGGLYATAAWWVGGLIAFLIARRFGRPVLQKYISFRKLDMWEEQIPEDVGFWGIVFSRILLPPSVSSYVVGLMRHISISRFALASFIGGIPISFLLVGLGSTVASGSFTTFIICSLFIVLVLVASYFGLWKRWQKEK